MKVRFTRRHNTIPDNKAYIGRDNPTIAQRIVDRIIERAEALGAQPHTGRASDLAGIRVASLARYRYLIFYSVSADEVHILHIRHMSRRPWKGAAR